MSSPAAPDLSQQNLGYQRAAAFLVHYIRKDTNAGNALLNEFGNSKDELERFIFALAEYAIAGAPGGRDQLRRPTAGSTPLGPTAEAFITGAAAAGNTRLGLGAGRAEHPRRRARPAALPRRPEQGGRVRPLAGHRRAVHPGGRRGDTAAHHRRGRPRAGAAPGPDPPPVRLRHRHLSGRWPRGREHVMSAAPPVLAPDLVEGLRRLKLAAMRQLAPELLQTAKTQRWAPEELLRTLVEAEITARDASNARTRLKTAAFPVVKTLD